MGIGLVMGPPTHWPLGLWFAGRRMADEDEGESSETRRMAAQPK